MSYQYAVDVAPPASEESSGMEVDFAVRSYTVKTKSGERKTILSDVFGAAKKGELLGIMGPSGAGKSTLLDTVAGIKAQRGAQHDSVVLLNGSPADKDRVARQRTCYVRQSDILVSSATVKEALTTSAFLRLPMSLSNAEKYARVEAIIDELGLRECENTLVGDESQGIKGLSGGQMRRLSVGIELVKDPQVIFLDEPTSGLDSEIALGIMQMLQTMAKRGRTVVCTIHQPNSDIVDTFDSYMLLAKGRVCYYGSWADSMRFFSEAGYPCPQYKNPSDHYMRVVSNPEGAAAVADFYAKSDMYTAAQSKAKSVMPESSTSLVPVTSRSGCFGHGRPVPSWFQFFILIKRFFKSMWRHPVAFVGEITQYWFMSVFVALMYLNISDVAPDAIYDRAASQWFVLVVLGFVPCFTATTMWIAESKVLRRETSDNTYAVSNFYIAKILSVVPYEIFFALTSSAIIYFAIGYQKDVAKFFLFAVILILVLMISQAYGLMAAALTQDPNGALIIVSLVLIVLLSFTGFLTSSVPVYFSWVKHISFLNFASSAMWVNELTGLVLTAADGSPVYGEDLLNSPEYSRLSNGLSIAQNIGLLIANLAILHTIALVSVNIYKHLNRL